MNRRDLLLLISSAALSGWAAGCGGKSRESYLPAASTARGTLQMVLQTWQSGTAFGPIKDSKPAINVFEGRWQAGQKLESYEILEEVKNADQPEFKVRIKLEGEPQETATYLVIGIDPINVFRDVEYKQSSQTM